MCTLKFDYRLADNPNLPYTPANISDKERGKLESEFNERYADYCERINADGGKVLISIEYKTGKIIDGHLVCSEQLYNEIHN